jgi:hypothetical protein
MFVTFTALGLLDLLLGNAGRCPVGWPSWGFRAGGFAMRRGVARRKAHVASLVDLLIFSLLPLVHDDTSMVKP